MSADNNDVVDSIVEDILNNDPGVTAETKAFLFTSEETVEGMDNQVPAWELMKIGKETKSSAFPVTVLHNDDIPDQIKSLIPTLNPLYAPHFGSAMAILRAWERDEPVLMTGPTGCGKSELLSHLCHLTNRPFIRVNMTEDIDSSMVFGSIGARAGSTYWENGPAADAAQYGAVLNIDEYDVTPAGIAMGFQWLLENRGKMFLKEKPGTTADKTMTLHRAFRVAFTGNTKGQGDDSGHFAGTQVQNTALIDRISCIVNLTYMTAAKELRVLSKAFPFINSEVLKKMILFANDCRGAYQRDEVGLTVSPRTLLNWCRKLGDTLDPKDALDLSYTNKLSTSDAKVVVKIYERSFGVQQYTRFQQVAAPA